MSFQNTLWDRRRFLHRCGASAFALGSALNPLLAQVAGERPNRAEDIEVLPPRGRIPTGWIFDDSTCLVNLNRFAMPQFDEAHGHKNPVYHKPWREWPHEIPDSFVRKFGEWSAEHGVKGKYSIVPYPACVGRLDRELPGWTRTELVASLDLVRKVIMPNWDIHPEMITHTRVLDLRTGHPYPEYTLKFMENWEWTTGKSTDELASYLAYALRILKEAGLPCEGITTPGGFGNRVLPELAQATLESVRDVFAAEIPHYFRHLYDRGTQSVAPRVEYASSLDGPDPKCVVSIIGCTGDWTGGWDCTPPEGADRFITPDLKRGRLVEVIERGEPAIMVSHWTGIYWNGQELGFKVLQEVVRRLHQRFDNLIWMKLSDLSRYWAAKELTTLSAAKGTLKLRAPFACPAFTLRVGNAGPARERVLKGRSGQTKLREVPHKLDLRAGTWCQDGSAAIACFDLEKGETELT
jgi:hypothetical protein